MRRLWPAVAMMLWLSMAVGALPPIPTNHTAAFANPLDTGWPQMRPVSRALADAAATIYLPLMIAPQPALVPGSDWSSPFGVQPIGSLTAASRLDRVVDLHSGWVRLGDRVSWRALQPNEGDPIAWERLAEFEQELRLAKQAGLTPLVVIHFSPRWATILPTSCGAIRPDKLPAFAAFVGALVARYSTEEFNVHHWELGNEPDVDPALVHADNSWGCWGDRKDPFYGGRGYGEMLKAVQPAIKAADAAAQVWVGGLLLNQPNNSSKDGRPELFLQGILEAEAAPYFDVLPYHIYAYYGTPLVDFDTVDAGPWKALGGRVIGKARFLKQLMATYNVDKPIVANEIGLLWCPTSANCPAPDMAFYDAQASFAVRSIVRGIGAGVQGFFWYPLEWPGFRYSALLYQDGTPKPVYTAYRQLALQLEQATYLHAVDYGAGVEAHAFGRGAEEVQVIWATEDIMLSFSIAQSQFVAAFDRDGGPIVPRSDGDMFYLDAGYKPIYVVVRR